MTTAMRDRDLFDKIKDIMSRGWIPLPQEPGYGGTGGPGRLLEALLGVSGGNLDIPDAGRWEIKFHSKNALLTLFHLEAKPEGHMHSMVRMFGIKDGKGRMSFRHTIRERSPKGFYVVNDNGRIMVCNDHENYTETAYWTHDALINAFVAKLRRVIVVKGRKKGGSVRYEAASAFDEPRSQLFIENIEKGIVAIDFDARTNNGKGLRNHGTKFRIRYDDLPDLYRRRQDIG